MKRKLLPTLMIALLCAIGAGYYLHLNKATANRDSTGDLTDNATDEIVISDASNQLLLRAAHCLKNWPALEATIRHKIDLFGQQLVGPGRYVQSGQGTRQARLELVFKSGDFNSRLTQINDGRFLYIKSDCEKDMPTQRIDLADLNKNAKPDSAENPSRWMAMGGLAYLLEELAEDFEFQPVTKSKLDDLDVLVLNGTWKKQRLAEICSAIKGVVSDEGEIHWDKLPEQLPTHVRILLGKDEPLGLFPHQVIYLRERREKSGQRITNPIATFEFYNVRPLADVDKTLFEVDKDRSRLTDITDSVHKTSQEEILQR